MSGKKTGQKRDHGMFKAFPDEKWAAIKLSYFKDRIFSVNELSVIHGIRAGSIRERMRREGWREELDIRDRRVDDVSNDENSKLDMAGLIAVKKDKAPRQFIEIATKLLDNLEKRSRFLGPKDADAISEMISSIKSLREMLGELLGIGKGASAARQVNVEWLTANIEAADRYMAERAAKRIAEEEAKRLVRPVV